jgi:hypothetical protein
VSKPDETLRLMPERVDLGQQLETTMDMPMMKREQWLKDGQPNPHGLRVVMGYYLPKWQRGLVWTEAQDIAFIQSAWRGLPLGTFSFNMVHDGSELDWILIDGQQRMHAIERYINDEFAVFGYRFSEVTEVDRRIWGMRIMFPSYRCHSKDEAFLRAYYDVMNFGGTPHAGERRASDVL